MTGARAKLGPFGVWAGSFQWPDDPAEVADAAAELEELGFGALWLGLSAGDLELHESILAATTRLVVASGIVNVWTEDPATVAASYHRIAGRYPDRFLLGLGAGHAETVEPTTGQRYVKPYSKVVSYLDELDAADPPVPAGDRVLAALGPRTLALSAERTAGAHPYLVPPEHTADARSIVGPSALVVSEQKVFFGADPDEARAVGRGAVGFYLGLVNYTNNLRRYGFTDEDLAGTGSDRLIDQLVAWGDDDAVAARVRAHLDAGADHTPLQLLSAEGGGLPRSEWRRAAEVLLH